MNGKNITLFLVLSCTLASCELAGDIFKAGVWVGFLIIITIVALVGFILFKIFNGKKT